MNVIDGAVWSVIAAMRQWVLEFCKVYMSEWVDMQDKEETEGLNWLKRGDGVYAFEAWFAIANGRVLTLSFTMVDAVSFKQRLKTKRWVVADLELKIVTKEGKFERIVPFSYEELRNSSLLTVRSPFAIVPEKGSFFEGAILLDKAAGRIWVVEDEQPHTADVVSFGFDGATEF